MNWFARRSLVSAAVIAAALFAAAAIAWTNFQAVNARAPVLPPAAGAIVPSHKPSGAVFPPRPLPAMTVTLENGETAELAALLSGHWTLVQLIFTGCSTTCPIQGAIFAKAQADLNAAGLEAGLLSLSIDPMGDDAKGLTRWLAGIGAAPGWRAAIPPYDSLGPLLDALGGRGKGIDIHDARAYLIGPDAALHYITDELPSPKLLVEMVRVAQREEARAAP